MHYAYDKYCHHQFALILVKIIVKFLILLTLKFKLNKLPYYVHKKNHYRVYSA